MNSQPTPPRSALEGATLLEDLGLIYAQGAEAATFLHSQMTTDMLKVGPDQARLAGYCNAQGRMLASFFVAWRPPAAAAAPSGSAGASLWLACSADLKTAMLKRLKMFVLRAKVTLEDAGGAACAIGLAGAAAAQWLGAAAVALAPWQQACIGTAAVVRLPDAAGLPRWLWLGDAAAATALLDALPALPAGAWNWLEVKSGVVRVVNATSAQFVPQMLNYELVGGVDFRKGCYPGQEVVARSQYLGKLKRRAFLLHAPLPLEAVREGQEIFWSGDAGQPAGIVAAVAADLPNGMAASVANGVQILAELKIAVTDSGALHLGSPTGPRLDVGQLPYEIPPVEAPTRL